MHEDRLRAAQSADPEALTEAIMIADDGNAGMDRHRDFACNHVAGGDLGRRGEAEGMKNAPIVIVSVGLLMGFVGSQYAIHELRGTIAMMAEQRESSLASIRLDLDHVSHQRDQALAAAQKNLNSANNALSAAAMNMETTKKLSRQREQALAIADRNLRTANGCISVLQGNR